MQTFICVFGTRSNGYVTECQVTASDESIAEHRAMVWAGDDFEYDHITVEELED